MYAGASSPRADDVSFARRSEPLLRMALLRASARSAAEDMDVDEDGDEEDEERTQSTRFSPSRGKASVTHPLLAYDRCPLSSIKNASLNNQTIWHHCLPSSRDSLLNGPTSTPSEGQIPTTSPHRMTSSLLTEGLGLLS